ncbi:MAG: hypothetical protein ACTSRP_11840 [Candidatus Helarchaeota archaeon]
MNKKKFYSILCLLEITFGIILLISMIVEIFFLRIFDENNLIKNVYVIFLGIGGITSIVGGLFSLGILPLLGCIPSLICMVLLLSDTEFWSIYRPDVLILLIISMLMGTLLIIFFQEFPVKIVPEVKELKLKELRGIKKKQIEKLEMIGISTLRELVEEKDNLKEISKLTNIDRNRLRMWVKEANDYQKQYQEYQKDRLKKSYKKIKKKR